MDFILSFSLPLNELFFFYRPNQLVNQLSYLSLHSACSLPVLSVPQQSGYLHYREERKAWRPQVTFAAATLLHSFPAVKTRSTFMAANLSISVAANIKLSL